MGDSSSSPRTTEGNFIMDLSNPFLLNHSDHPAIILDNKLLDRDNYGTRIHLISGALSTKNKTGFVDGSLCID